MAIERLLRALGEDCNGQYLWVFRKGKMLDSSGAKEKLEFNRILFSLWSDTLSVKLEMI